MEEIPLGGCVNVFVVGNLHFLRVLQNEQLLVVFSANGRHRGVHVGTSLTNCRNGIANIYSVAAIYHNIFIYLAN